MARKRPSRVPRTATPRKASDNRYREWSEIHNDYKLVDENGTRLVLFNGESGGTVLGPWIGPDGNRSARRNRRANLTLTPSDITWTARERQPGFFWVDGIDSEGYHYEQGLVPASSAREAIEEMESSYQYSLRRGNRNRRANRRYATSNKTSMLSSEFFGMGWANGHTGLVGHFVMYDKWLGDMVRAGTINGPKELEREFMASRARELENMSDIDWSQVDWDDVYDFLNGK